MVEQKNNSTKVKYTATKVIMQNVLNPNKYTRKLQLKEELNRIFDEREGAELRQLLDNSSYNPKKLREVNNSIKRANKDLSLLDTVCQDSVLNELINKYHLTVPAPNAKTPELKQKFLFTKLQSCKQKFELDRNLVQEEKEQHDKLLKEYEKLKKDVFGRWRTEYQARKKTATTEYSAHYKQLSQDMKKEEREQHMSESKLQEALQSAPAELKEVFDIKYQIDQISSDSYRISKGCNVLSMLTLKVLSQIVSAASRTHDLKNEECRTFNANLLETGSDQGRRKIKSQINNEDIRDSIFEPTAFNSLFNKLSSFRDLRSGRQVQSYGYTDLLLVTVKNYIKEIELKFEKSSLLLISEILSNFVISLTNLLPDQLKNMKINTVKVEMFHTILNVVYSMAGEDYTNMKALVDATWPKAKKEEDL